MSSNDDTIRDPDSPDEPESPFDALESLFSQLGIPTNGATDVEGLLEPLMRQMMSQFQGGGDDEATIWSAAHQTARRVVASLGPDPSPSNRQSREVADAVRLVELWLNEHTVFPALALPPMAWSRAEWIEDTLPQWEAMIEPVVSTISGGLRTAMEERMGAAEGGEAASIQAMMQPMLGQAADTMFGSRVGQSLGTMASGVVTATDIGFPLTSHAQVAILPANLAGFASETDLDPGDLLLYHAMRETARQRLFSAVAWIGPQLIALVQHYARETSIDPEALAAAMDDIMPTEMTLESINKFELEVNTILFDPVKTDEQTAILERLELLLALVEGWVGDVVATTSAQWLPAASALDETLRRNRAAVGSANDVFASLIGLEIRPRLVREAAAFWAAIRQSKGLPGRDEIWSHPDTMPTAEQIADPATYLAGLDAPAQEDRWDEELRRLLDGDTPDAPQP
ncbi:MAG: zinc-dependent metalloprotease [Propionibacteriaceae bacterium]|nr:zinc-dependent metalloprotease [Propionibacteriaceae bacterium]